MCAVSVPYFHSGCACESGRAPFLLFLSLSPSLPELPLLCLTCQWGCKWSAWTPHAIQAHIKVSMESPPSVFCGLLPSRGRFVSFVVPVQNRMREPARFLFTCFKTRNKSPEREKKNHIQNPKREGTVPLVERSWLKSHLSIMGCTSV